MANFRFKFATTFALLLGSANSALADIPPQPDPTDPTTFLMFAIAIGTAVATGVGYFIYMQRRK